MTAERLETSLRSHSAFRDLTDATVQQVIATASETLHQPGALLVTEGDTGHDLFLILDGSAQAFRTTKDGEEVVLNAIGAGDCIGELSLLDGSARAASVRVTSPSRVVRIHVDGLTDPHALTELKAAVAAVAVGRARQLSDAQLTSVQAQLEARTLQTQFGMVLVFTIALLLLSTSLFYLVAEDMVDDIYAPVFSWQAVLLFAVPCLAIIAYLKIPLRDLGIKREGLWRSTWQALALTGVIAAPVLIYITFFKDPIPPEDRPVQITPFFLVQYFFHSALQEVGARGLLQGLFQRFFSDAKGHQAVALSSVIFGSMHITFGAEAVVLTFLASLLFGYVYLYQKNLAGAIIVHYGLGVLAALLVAL